MSEAEQSVASLKERFLIAIGLSIWFVVIYTGSNYITSLRSDLGEAYFDWELGMPFVPILIIPYWSVDAFFFCAAIVSSRREALYLFAKRMLLAIGLAGICFLLFPLRLAFVRPPVEGFLGTLFGSLETMYNFYNLSPSLHIAIRCILWTVYIPLVSGFLRRFLQVWFILIGVSTLLCWQHHVIDVFTGQLLGLFAIHILPERSAAPLCGNRLTGENANSRLAVYYFSGAVLFAALAWVLPLWGILFLWPAVSLLVIAAAYIGRGPAIFRKQHGRTPNGTKLLFSPYYLGLWLSFRHYTSGRSSLDSVLPHVFLGRIPKSEEVSKLIEAGVDEVLDLTAEWEEARPIRGLRYHNIPILDLTLPSRQQFEEARVILRAARESGRKVLVHCSLGWGRGAAIIAYYMVAEGLAGTLNEAIESIEKARPGIIIGDSKRQHLESIFG